MKIVIVILLVAILAALAAAGVFMLRRGKDDAAQDPKSMARALALRVALSVSLFLIVLLAWWAGWIRPSGIPMGPG
jgi:flagellar basal body-associated protein FliL